LRRAKKTLETDRELPPLFLLLLLLLLFASTVKFRGRGLMGKSER